MKNLKISTAIIAKICGVSQGTVDRALNNRSDIKAETKEKILKVAKNYGYRDYVSTQITKNIGIIVFNLENEYFSELITELEYISREKGYCTTVMMSHYDKQYELECIRNLYNMGVEGIVLCSVNSGKEFGNYLKLFDIPIVAVGNKTNAVPYVGIDDFSAMKEMTLKVLDDKPDSIIYYSPALNYGGTNAQRKRYEGFLNAIGNTKFSVVTDIEDIKEAYDEKTTVICSTDYYAFQVYYKAKNAKVIGFDNVKSIDKHKVHIDSVGYSMSEIANGVMEIIEKKKNTDIIIKHNIIKK